MTSPVQDDYHQNIFQKLPIKKYDNANHPLAKIWRTDILGMKFLKSNEYQKASMELFNLMEKKLRNSLPTARIEHIGASSVPGAISKGDLDIFVGLDNDRLEKGIQAISELGFEIKQNTLRTSELCMMESKTQDNLSVQVVANGSKFEFFLHFRDILKNHPTVLSEYNRLKEKCEDYGEDEYREIKSNFIEKILKEYGF